MCFEGCFDIIQAEGADEIATRVDRQYQIEEQHMFLHQMLIQVTPSMKALLGHILHQKVQLMIS